jgi:hypothetical protein
MTITSTLPEAVGMNGVANNVQVVSQYVRLGVKYEPDMRSDTYKSNANAEFVQRIIDIAPRSHAVVQLVAYSWFTTVLKAFETAIFFIPSY